MSQENSLKKIKELREVTGVGFKDCKSAIDESNGDIEKAIILLRKKGKLPAERLSQDFVLEYGKATIEVHKDSIEQNDSVLIIDDLIATGGTAEAGAKLIEKSGGKVAGFVFVINLFDLNGTKKLIEKGYKVTSLINFPGH